MQFLYYINSDVYLLIAIIFTICLVMIKFINFYQSINKKSNHTIFFPDEDYPAILKGRTYLLFAFFLSWILWVLNTHRSLDFFNVFLALILSLAAILVTISLGFFLQNKREHIKFPLSKLVGRKAKVCIPVSPNQAEGGKIRINFKGIRTYSCKTNEEMLLAEGSIVWITGFEEDCLIVKADKYKTNNRP